MLRDIQESRKHLAIVVNEFDEAYPDTTIRKISEGIFVVVMDGKTLISEIESALARKEDFFYRNKR